MRTPHPHEPVDLLVVCTGNAARSVMAGLMLEHLAGRAGIVLRVVTAGTHTVEGQPMGVRTREALVGIAEMAMAPVASHRSRQLLDDDTTRADLVIAMEADHVRFVRRHHRGAAPRTATFRGLARVLPAGPVPLADRLRRMDLQAVPLDDGEDVLDPAGGGDDVYRACAEELWRLSSALVLRL